MAAIEELDVDDMQFLQADVKGLELLVVPVQWNNLEKAVVEPQANHPALGVNDADDAGLRGPADSVLGSKTGSGKSLHTHSHRGPGTASPGRVSRGGRTGGICVTGRKPSASAWLSVKHGTQWILSFTLSPGP